jgi:hypothetical protein
VGQIPEEQSEQGKTGHSLGIGANQIKLHINFTVSERQTYQLGIGLERAECPKPQEVFAGRLHFIRNTNSAQARAIFKYHSSCTEHGLNQAL